MSISNLTFPNPNTLYAGTIHVDELDATNVDLGNVLYIDNLNKRVGINSPNPSEALCIISNQAGLSSEGISVATKDGGALKLLPYDGNFSYFEIGTADANGDIIPGSAGVLKVSSQGGANEVITVNSQTKEVQFGGNVYLPTVGSIASPINYYEEYILPAVSYSGAITELVANIVICRFNNIVNINFITTPQYLVTANQQITTVSVIPNRFLGTVISNKVFNIKLSINGSYVTCSCVINSLGELTIYNGENGAFVNGTNINWEYCGASWIIQ